MMKRFLTFLSLVLLIGCASTTPSSRIDAPDPKGVIQLIGGSMASGCPISEKTALTAKHVVEKEDFFQTKIEKGFAWEDGLGNEGIVVPLWGSDHFDLAFLESEIPFPTFYPIAKEKPKVGDKVYWSEFDWRSEDQAFSRRLREATITRVVAHHVVSKPAPTVGASGGCLLNEKLEIIGIVVAKVPTWAEGALWTRQTGSVGLAVGVWGFTFPKGSEQQ